MNPEEAESPFRRVSIVGLGAMGGALAQALTALPSPPGRVGWSPAEGEGEAALADGALLRLASSVEDAVADADLVVLAAPLSACIDLVPIVLRAMPSDAVLTDVASLKAPILAAVTQAGASHRWVGSHPMCGTTGSGYTAARADLYAQARIWVVETAESGAATERLFDFWRSVGAEPATMAADAHDALMALTSHAPQLTANALARVLQDQGVTTDALGPGGLDVTRLAASSPEMWRDILSHASPALSDALRALAHNAEKLADMLDSGDDAGLAQWMESTRQWRNTP